MCAAISGDLEVVDTLIDANVELHLKDIVSQYEHDNLNDHFFIAIASVDRMEETHWIWPSNTRTTM